MHVEPVPTLSHLPPDHSDRLDSTVHEASDAARYRWMRDHCSNEDLQALVALIRAQHGQINRQTTIDRAVDAHIAADLLSRETAPG